MSNDHNVTEWNRELAQLLIPNDIILCLYVLLGISGNSLVLYIYTFRLSGKMGDRYFIPFLAVMDMLASTVCGTFGVALNMMQATFFNSSLCKAWWFFAAFTTFMSTFTLLAIAIQRYLKVVKPNGRQMNLKWNRLALLCIFVIAVVCAVPTTMLYGSVPFSNSDGSITGKRCSKLKGENKVGSLVYGSVIGFITIFVVGALIGLYTSIGRTIFLHMRRMKRRPNAEKEESATSTKVTSVDEYPSKCNETRCDNSQTWNENMVDIQDDTGFRKENKQMTMSRVNPEQKNYNFKKIIQVDLHKKINKNIRHQFTLMFLLITVIFLICYIPKVIIMLMEALNPKFWEEFSDTGRAAMLFVYRMYIINNISNPFVYAFLDLKFRSEFVKLCRFCKR